MFKRNPLPRPSVPLPILPQFSLRRRCGAQTARAAAVAAAVVVAVSAVAAAAAAAAPSSSKQTARGAGRRGIAWFTWVWCRVPILFGFLYHGMILGFLGMYFDAAVVFVTNS